MARPARVCAVGFHLFRFHNKKRHKVMKAFIRLFMLIPAIVIVGCANHRGVIYGPMQPDGWSAQPISINCRFAPDADLDPVTGTPVGDEGYYLYILTEAANWDYSHTTALLYSHRRPRESDTTLP